MIQIGVISVIIFFIGLLLAPFLITLIPADYFIKLDDKLRVKNLFYYVVVILKNILGFVLLVLGFIMLFIPGQGLFTIIVGLFLMDFPNKHKFEKKLINNDYVFETLNWLRAKFKKPLFKRE